MRLAVGARTVAIEVLGGRATDALEEQPGLHRGTTAGSHDAHRDRALGRQAQVAEVARFAVGERCDGEALFRPLLATLHEERVVARRQVAHLEAVVARVAIRFDAAASVHGPDGEPVHRRAIGREHPTAQRRRSRRGVRHDDGAEHARRGLRRPSHGDRSIPQAAMHEHAGRPRRGRRERETALYVGLHGHREVVAIDAGPPPGERRSGRVDELQRIRGEPLHDDVPFARIDGEVAFDVDRDDRRPFDTQRLHDGGRAAEAEAPVGVGRARDAVRTTESDDDARDRCAILIDDAAAQRDATRQHDAHRVA